MMPSLSIVVPAFNESEIIKNSILRIYEIAEGLNSTFEILIVDDGSQDATWTHICELSTELPSIRGIRFSRNFGKEQAMLAGLDKAKGEAVILIDADLQHPPELIGDMYEIWKQGNFDVVRAVKMHRGTESLFSKICSKLFYRIMRAISGLELQDASDFVLLDKKVISAIKFFPEQKPFIRGLVLWVGFRQSIVEFEVAPRVGGETKWKRSALIKYALSNFLAFSSLPLRLVNYLALFFFIFALALGGYSLYKYIANDSVEGFTTVIILLLLIGSSLMIGLGIIGEYVAKIHEGVQHRPRYLTMDEVGS